ncbi:MAG: undecaprenyl/decaprenyl-phosphate alpha-N-acetylglucosaminyl 1-phosphate transferase [Staphylococcus sp.]|nr:undecaprenyl/decaprenyl-phosphate alpha-N-acetylglucosaminyl 1-phosphate transferase [Staphylococcus sp.]
MGYWSINSLITFFLCALLAGVLIPQILLIAYRRNLFDEVNERKIHKGLVPRLGGIAFVPVILVSIAVLLEGNLRLGYMQFSGALYDSFLPLLSTFIALQLLYLVGIADDLIGVKYRAKFVVQIVCALFLLGGGVWFSNLGGVLGIEAISPWIGYPFTVVVLVFLINAINLIDGIDGLASGLSSIACVIYGCAFMFLGEYALSIVSFATLGVLVPFFYYNVFGDVKKHSKIFMGDTGSLTIGLILGVLGTLLYTHPDSPEISINPSVIAFSPLIVPCFDVIRVYMLRIRQHRSPFMPDKNHIHHKLLAAGMKPRMAMITIVSVSATFTIVNFLLSRYLNVNINLLVVLDVVVWTVANLWLAKVIKSKTAAAGEQK